MTMNRFRYVLLLFSFTQVSFGQQSFSLEEAVQYAQQHDLQVQNSRLEEEISATEVERLQRNWLPQASASADLRYNPILQTNVLGVNPATGMREVAEVEFGTDFTSSVGVLVQQKVFDPVYRPERERRSLGGRQAELERNYQEQRTAWQVRAAYYQVLLNRDILQNSRRLLAAIDTLRRDMRVQVQEELESPRLLNQLNEQYWQQQSKLRVDSLSWLASQADLKLEMNFPAGQTLSLTDSLELSLEETVSLDASDNYQVQQINLQLEASRIALDRLQRSRLPSVNAEGFLGANFFSDAPDLYKFDRWYGQSYIGLTMSVPIYQGNDKRYGEQLENLKMEQLRNEADAYRNEQQNKAIRVALQMEQARAQLRLARQLTESAAENLRLARTNYRNEVAGFRPVLEALQSLVGAREQEINGRIAYVQALLEASLLDL